MYDYSARYMEPAIGRFTSVDPLAEKYYSISPYAYVGNNPLKYIDPTGMYDIDAIQKGEQYGVVAVYATGAEKDKALAKDIAAAKEAGIPVIYVDNIEDYANAMNAITEIGASTGTYTLNSHGSAGSFKIGSDRITSKTDLSSLKDGLAGKNVFIGACSVVVDGNLSGRNLIEKFSDQTGSTVTASDHPIIAGYSYDGKKGLNGPTSRMETIGNALFGDNYANGFYTAKPEQSANKVYNVTIDKKGTVKSNSGNLSRFRNIQPSPYVNSFIIKEI